MKREKFIKLAESRTSNAIKQIKLLGNLANTNSYEYREDDIQKIFSALSQELKRSRAKFEAAPEAKNSEEFKLSL